MQRGFYFGVYPDEPAGGMGDRLDVFYEPGRLEVTARPEETDRERIEGVFETILTGYDLLAQSYPAHVTLERREANDGKGSD